MLQNRVNPFGELIETKAKGAWLGNRGQLHGSGKTILRPFKHQAWIICLLQFKNRHREIMAPNLWTELFFLDEATALAAGHRPCFECRRADANLFKAAWINGNPQYGFDSKTPIGKIDAVLQQERIDQSGAKLTYQARLEELPMGIFIEIDSEAFLWTDQTAYQWTPFGYTLKKILNVKEEVRVLTPKSIVAAIQAGYQPQLNFSLSRPFAVNG